MADLVTPANFKTAMGITGNTQDAKISLAIADATTAILNYTDRDFTAAQVTESRTFKYNGRGYLDIDDASAVNTVSVAGTALAADSFLARPDRGPIFTYLELPARGISPEMGFTRNLDTWLLDRGWMRIDAVVNANWGWPAVPTDVRRAAIITASAFLDDSAASGSSGEVVSESIAEVARAYAQPQAQSVRDSIPGRATALLEPYRRVVI